MPAPIVVINPNSTQAVTDGMHEAVDSLRRPGGPAIECVTMESGPPGVETQMDAESVVLPICDYVHGRNDDASAFVIGCYSDPGLHAAREIARVPVFGIAESAMATALTRGDRFGVISILPGIGPSPRPPSAGDGARGPFRRGPPGRLWGDRARRRGRGLRTDGGDRTPPSQRMRGGRGDPRLHGHGPVPAAPGILAGASGRRADPRRRRPSPWGWSPPDRSARTRPGGGWKAGAQPR